MSASNTRLSRKLYSEFNYFDMNDDAEEFSCCHTVRGKHCSAVGRCSALSLDTPHTNATTISERSSPPSYEQRVSIFTNKNLRNFMSAKTQQIHTYESFRHPVSKHVPVDQGTTWAEAYAYAYRQQADVCVVLSWKIMYASGTVASHCQCT
jgi:hypothetical protein